MIFWPKHIWRTIKMMCFLCKKSLLSIWLSESFASTRIIQLKIEHDLMKHCLSYVYAAKGYEIILSMFWTETIIPIFLTYSGCDFVAIFPIITDHNMPLISGWYFRFPLKAQFPCIYYGRYSEK